MAFKPVHKHELTDEEMRKSIHFSSFFVQKKNGDIEKRQCVNESFQRAHADEKEAISSTALTDSVMTTLCIDAQEGRNVTSTDALNAFTQTMMLIEDDEKRVMMKSTEETVNSLFEIDKKAHKKCVTHEKGRKTLCV